MPFTSPHHLNFNHVYTETIFLPDNVTQPEAFRAVRRDGNYAPTLSFASGITFLERYGTRNLAFNGFGLDPSVSVPNLKTAIPYPAGGTAVNAGDILKNANTNKFYFVPANTTLDNTGATLDDRIANDLAAGDVIEVPFNIFQDNANASSTPFAPSILGHQRIIPMCTDGIAIVEIATVASAAASGAAITSTAAIAVDDPLYVVDDEGRIGAPDTPAATDYIIGRSLDAITVPAESPGFGIPAGYIRIKLGSI